MGKSNPTCMVTMATRCLPVHPHIHTSYHRLHDVTWPNVEYNMDDGVPVLNEGSVVVVGMDIVHNVIYGITRHLLHIYTIWDRDSWNWCENVLGKISLFVGGNRGS